MNIDKPIKRCTKCQGDVWDNRKNKKNPRGPDFKCKKCDEAFWLSGPAAEEAAAAREIAQATAPESWKELELMYRASLEIAQRALTDIIGEDVSADVIHAGAATVLIGAQKMGLGAP